MKEITDDILMVIAGDLEKLLLENQSQMAWAFKKLAGEMKISMSVNLDSNGDGITVNYDLSFDLEPKPDPPEKHKVKYKHTINPLQSSMEFISKAIRDGKMSIEAGGKKIGSVS